MHLIERYATDCALKIDKPFLYESYFPLPFEKYILIHGNSGMSAKNYDFWPEVVTILRSILSESGYEIMQIGSKDDPAISNTIDLRGKTNMHQTAYLIRRAAALIGNDSCNIHFASGFDTPLIALYGSTSPKNSGPYFGNKEKQIILEADRKGNKPSFSREENPKTINTILPEKVAQSVLDLLKIDQKINIETIFIGGQYNNFTIEFVPDSIIRQDFFQSSVFNARMDYLFNEEALAQNLAIRPLCILTDKSININLLQRFRQNVAMVIYNLDENLSVEFVKSMLESGIPYQLISSLEDAALAEAKLKMFDYGIILPKKKMNEKSFENFEKVVKLKSKFKTHKFLLSNNKIYLTKKDWMEQKPISDFSQNKGVVPEDDPDFWESLDFLYLFQEL